MIWNVPTLCRQIVAVSADTLREAREKVEVNNNISLTMWAEDPRANSQEQALNPQSYFDGLKDKFATAIIKASHVSH